MQTNILVGMESIARYVGRPEETISAWVRGKHFPARRIDGRGPYMAHAGTIDEWVIRQTVEWRREDAENMGMDGCSRRGSI